jgi:hypothetical protein
MQIVMMVAHVPVEVVALIRKEVNAATRSTFRDPFQVQDLRDVLGARVRARTIQ